MFDETVIENRKWRKELNTILLDPDARDQSRLFLVCFLREKLKWDQEKICWFIGYYSRWSDYKEKETKRQVENIFKRYEKGLVGSKVFHNRRKVQTSFSSQVQNETWHDEKPTDPGNNPVPCVRVYSHMENRCLAHEVLFTDGPTEARPSVGFVVSSESEEREEETKNMEETKIFGKINDGNKFFRVVEKTGEYGAFISLDSGPLMDAITDEGKTIMAFGRPNKFFTLPKEPDVMEKLITILQSTLPQQIKGTKKK